MHLRMKIRSWELGWSVWPLDTFSSHLTVNFFSNSIFYLMGRIRLILCISFIEIPFCLFFFPSAWTTEKVMTSHLHINVERSFCFLESYEWLNDTNNGNNKPQILPNTSGCKYYIKDDFWWPLEYFFIWLSVVNLRFKFVKWRKNVFSSLTRRFTTDNAELYRVRKQFNPNLSINRPLSHGGHFGVSLSQPFCSSSLTMN